MKTNKSKWTINLKTVLNSVTIPINTLNTTSLNASIKKSDYKNIKKQHPDLCGLK